MIDDRVDIFDYDDYKSFLEGYISGNAGIRGIKSFLAKAAGTERSYFSQVLNSKAQLTPDQAYQLSLSLEMTEGEREYWMLLVECGRTGTLTYKKFLLKKAEVVRAKNQDLKVKFNDPPRLTEKAEMVYFSKWYMVATHLLCGVFQREQASRIAETLGLPKSLILESVVELKTLGLLEQTGGIWKPTQEVLYVHKSSPLCDIHHINWRQQAILDMQKKRDHSLHMTAVHSIAKKDFEKIKQLILAFVKTGMELSKKSKEEHLACLNIDYFHFD
jgi:uncharacterized protein (TIGR02147 family)